MNFHKMPSAKTAAKTLYKKKTAKKKLTPQTKPRPKFFDIDSEDRSNT